MSKDQDLNDLIQLFADSQIDEEDLQAGDTDQSTYLYIDMMKNKNNKYIRNQRRIYSCMRWTQANINKLVQCCQSYNNDARAIQQNEFPSYPLSKIQSQIYSLRVLG